MSLERVDPEMETGQSRLFSESEHFRNSMLRKYKLDGAYDEMFSAEGEVRPHYRRLMEMFARMPQEEDRKSTRLNSSHSSPSRMPSSA